jgi:rubrerythrin
VAYTVDDIIEKLILIEKDSMDVYTVIAEKFKDTNKSISIIAKTLYKEEKRHVDYYETIRSEFKEYKHEEIEFYLYDKASKLLYEYKQRVQVPQLKSVKELLTYAVDFERNNISLLLDIQGRLVQSPMDIVKLSYEIISNMIEEEKSHEEQLQKLLNKLYTI